MKTDEQVNKLAHEAALSQYKNTEHEDYESTVNGFIIGYNEAVRDLEQTKELCQLITVLQDCTNAMEYGDINEESTKTEWQNIIARGNQALKKSNEEIKKYSIDKGLINYLKENKHTIIEIRNKI